MTIKKRLFISNILMILLPFIASVATFTACVFILNLLSGGALMNMMIEREIVTVQRAGHPAYTNTVSTLISILVFTGSVTIMVITNIFLTKFVFRKIKQPLEMLSDGVRQISDGNLDYKIAYSGNDEFKPVCEDFNKMAARLLASIAEVQKNEQNRKELIAGISHDLRSPLTSIKGFVEGLLDGVADTPDSRQEYLQIIKQKTDDITSMVSQLFLYSKMDMGNYPTRPEKLNAANEIKDFVSASREEYKAKGLSIEIDGMPQNKYIRADPLHLRSVFANILGNSAKYKIKDTASASIYCIEDDGVIRIIFEDDGPGVPEGEIPKLFEVFYRGDLSRNNPNQGSGLGLAIAAKALERMNGRIYAENITTPPFGHPSAEGNGGLRMIVEIPEMKEEIAK